VPLGNAYPGQRKRNFLPRFYDTLVLCLISDLTGKVDNQSSSSPVLINIGFGSIV
jgi:hypothetical protein